MMAASNRTHPTPPHRTSHAAIQWERRTRDARPDDIWTAWIDAEPVTLPAPWAQGRDDEARYYRDERVALIRSGSRLVTVFDLTGPDSQPAARRAVENQLNITLEATR